MLLLGKLISVIFFFNFLLSQDPVSLKSSLSPRDENPCFIYLNCGPNGGEEILSVGVLSSARNMEVYLGEEYCGTSRGKTACTVLDDRFVTCLDESVHMNQCLYSQLVMFVDFLRLTGQESLGKRS